jgi:hypothetical protein
VQEHQGHSRLGMSIRAFYPVTEEPLDASEGIVALLEGGCDDPLVQLLRSVVDHREAGDLEAAGVARAGSR